MGSMDGRVAIVTGAGRGLGRAHALLLAREGASVVVNDHGGGLTGGVEDPGPAGQAADAIRELGGKAVANCDDVASWEGGRSLVEAAVSAFGALHVVVNNAGNLRRQLVVDMSESEWDDVVRVHLKGHFVTTHWAAQHWRSEHESGCRVPRAIVNTTSTSGLLGNPKASNYGAAKAGIAALTIISARELQSLDVRVNAVAPAARTRMSTGAWDDPSDPASFDPGDPSNVSPLVAVLAGADCAITGRVFFVAGGTVQYFEPWRLGASITRDSRWPVDELAEALQRIIGPAAEDPTEVMQRVTESSR
jgi:NAD(P)-dependent dehydrogenase (short-subunit alcohol dehydrogenase family)